MKTHMNANRALRCLAVVIVLTLSAKNGAAQWAAPDAFPGRSATELMSTYSRGLANTDERQRLLVGVLNKGLPINETNVSGARQHLAKSGAVEEKILLIRVLASMYVPGARSVLNLQIESDIKKLIDSVEPRLAVEAVLEYSRLGSPDDRYQILRRAWAAKKIDDDAYYGELAHGLRFSTAAQQDRMLDELELARNTFGNEVLAATFAGTAQLKQLTPSSQARLYEILVAREPRFPPALDSFGGIDVARYAIWTDAVAVIGSALTGKDYADLVLLRLSGPQVDPRKILAVFGSPEGRRVLAESKDAATLARLLSRAQGYSHSLPSNVMMREAAAGFAARLKTSGSAGNGQR